MRIRSTAYGLSIAALLFVVFVLLTAYVYLHPVNGFDAAAIRGLQEQPWAKPLYYSNALFRAPAFRALYVILVLLFIALRRYALGLFVVGAPLSEVVAYVIKRAIERPRPYGQYATILDPSTGYSFVSGHTLEYTLLFGFLGYLVLVAIKTGTMRYVVAGLLFSLPVIVGLGRVYTGAHWLTDIIGSYILGVALLLSALCLGQRGVAPPRRFR